MGKRYLNREEKLDLFKLTAFFNYLENLIGKLQKHNPDKDQIKYLKLSKTYINKAGAKFMESLDPMEINKLIGSFNTVGQLVKPGEFHKMELVVKHKDEALREYREALKDDSHIAIETDDFMIMFNLCLASCELCEGLGEMVTDCPFRKVFHKYDMPILNYEAGPGVCQYKQPDKGGIG